MPFWPTPRRAERQGMRMLQPQGLRLSRQTSMMLGLTARHGESARKNEDGAVAVEEKVNGRSYCG